MSHEIVKAYIFTGGEYVDDTNIKAEVEWTKEGLIAALSDCLSAYVEDEVCENMFASGPVKIRDTIEFVSEGLAQAVECPCDGGMVYIVRIYD